MPHLKKAGVLFRKKKLLPLDLNKINNDILNLEAMPKNQHTKLHQELKCQK